MAFSDQCTRDRPDVAARPESARVESARTEADRTMSGERVLVVDDEPIVTEVVQRYLIREGYQVQVAADGRVGAARGPRRRTRPGGPRSDAARDRRPGGLPAASGREQRPDHHADGQGRGERQDPRPRAGRGRLPDQAVQPRRADRPGQGGAAPHPGRRARRLPRRRASGSAGCGSTPAAGPSSATASRSTSPPRSSTCSTSWPAAPARSSPASSCWTTSGTSSGTATRAPSPSTSAACARRSSRTPSARATSRRSGASATSSKP